MTRKQASELLETIAAYGCGKNVQWKSQSSKDWNDSDDPTFSTHFEWRIKPDPKTRPWSKPEDVPGPVCWIRKRREPSIAWLISQVDNTGVYLDGGGFTFIDDDFAKLEYSLDRKTWHKCEVTEEAP